MRGNLLVAFDHQHHIEQHDDDAGENQPAQRDENDSAQQTELPSFALVQPKHSGNDRNKQRDQRHARSALRQRLKLQMPIPFAAAAGERFQADQPFEGFGHVVLLIRLNC